jgi:hypothetical protein
MMARDPLEVVKLYSGPPVLVEVYQAALAEAGITSDVVGTELAGGIGSALPAPVELWVHRADLARARTVLDGELGGKPAHDRPRPRFPHPTDSPKPAAAPHRKEPHVNPDPRA